MERMRSSCCALPRAVHIGETSSNSEGSQARPRADAYASPQRGERAEHRQRERIEMVGVTGIEPVTPSMSTRCSPAELYARLFGEGHKSRPRDARSSAVQE